jgi:predicted DNA-binding transcriptional regulator YafY
LKEFDVSRRTVARDLDFLESLEGDVTIEPDWLSEHVGVLPEDRVRIDQEVWA